MSIGLRTPGKRVGAIIACPIMTLSRDDNSAFPAANDDGLVPSRMTGSRYDEYAGQHLRLTIELLVLQPGRVDELGQRVTGSAGTLELDSLGQDRPAGQLRVAAAVIEVQVTVDDELDVLGAGTYVIQRCRQRAAVRVVVIIDLTVAAHPGVHQQQGARVLDEVAKAGFNTRPASCFLGRPDEMAEVHSPYD